MEDIKDSDYNDAKRVFKDFEVKRLGGYHDLYLKSSTLLLADVFESFRKMCLDIYKLDPEKCLSATGLELLADINILLMVEKGIRGGICHVIH